MKTSLLAAALGLALVSVACATPSEPEEGTQEGAAKQSCGTPATKTPFSAQAYVLTNRPTFGDAITRIGFDGETKKFRGIRMTADGEVLIKGSFEILTPRCPTSDRRLVLTLDGNQGTYAFLVKPKGEGYALEEDTETEHTWGDLELTPLAEDAQKDGSPQCAKPNDCAYWAYDNKVSAPRCGQWFCEEGNVCRHSSWPAKGETSPRSCN